MALERAWGTLAPTATGNFSVSGLSFQPKVVLLLGISHRTPGSNSLETINAFSHGAAISSSEQYCLGGWTQNSGGVTDGSEVISNADCLNIPHPNGAGYITRIQCVSLNSDGFTLNASVINATWDINIQWLALGGTDLTSVAIEGFTAKTSTGTQAYTGVGFQPDGALFFMNNETSTSNPQLRNDGPVFSFGAADGVNEFGIGWASAAAETNSIEASRLRTDRCLALISDDETTILGDASLDSFDADGWTLNWHTVGGGAYRGFAVLFEGPSFKVGSISQATSTGTEAYTGVGFQPVAIGLFGIGQTASAGFQSDAVFQAGYGVSSTERGAIWVRSTDGLATPDPNQTFETDSIIDFFDTSDALVYSADLDSLDADGFTLDFTTTDATARQIVYWAFGDAGSGPQDVFRDAESTVTITQTTIQSGDFNRSAESTLTIVQTASFPSVEVTASNSLVIDQTATFQGPIYASAESEVEITSSAHRAENIDKSASTLVTITQTATQSGPIYRDAETLVVVESSADLSEKHRAATSTLTITQTVEHTVSKLVKTIVTVSHEAKAVVVGQTAAHTLTITQTAEVITPTVSQVVIVSTAEVEREPGTKLIFHTLDITQEVVLQADRFLSASNSLTVTQTFTYYKVGATTLTDYTPFVGSTGITTAIVQPDQPSYTKGLTLTYPFAAPTINVALTSSMNLGDKDRLGFDRINRETRGGQLLVYADPQWPKNQRLVFTVSNIKRVEALAILSFVQQSLGQEIGLLTHEGFQWRGILINPQDAVVQDHRDSYTISIEFEGQLV